MRYLLVQTQQIKKTVGCRYEFALRARAPGTAVRPRWPPRLSAADPPSRTWVTPGPCPYVWLPAGLSGSPRGCSQAEQAAYSAIPPYSLGDARQRTKIARQRAEFARPPDVATLYSPCRAILVRLSSSVRRRPADGLRGLACDRSATPPTPSTKP